MRFINLLIVAFLFVGINSQGAYEVKRRDLKLPNQKLMRTQSVENAALGAADAILDDEDGDDDGNAVTVTTFVSQPDVPRVLSVTPGGTTADVAAGNVVITGTNIYGETITDTLAFLANASTATTGTKAFASVTSIVFPVEDSPYGATWDVGETDSIGLDRCMDADNVVFATFDGAYEGTRPTVGYDADEVEKNFANPNGTLNGAKDLFFYYIENYRCNP
jgi:hypothetical protein